jgi:hypothetical protein
MDVKDLEKQEQTKTKTKISKQKKIINVRAEINEIQLRNCKESMKQKVDSSKR